MSEMTVVVDGQAYIVDVYEDLEDGGFVGVVRGLTGCITQGDDLDELKTMLKDAIQGWINIEREDGQWQ